MLDCIAYYRNADSSLAAIRVTNSESPDAARLGVADYLLENKLASTSPVFLLIQGGKV